MNVLKPHVSLNVSNIERSVAFYEKAFGVTATKRRPGYAKFDLQSPSLNLTMQEAPRTGVNASHFGVQVATTDDVIEAKGRFEALGLETFVEENTTCCYAVQDKVWIEDPDGNSWEVFVVKADVSVTAEAPVMNTGVPVMKADASPCCVPAEASREPAVQTSGCCSPAQRDAG
jgi:catechol 2,3-dioxygenase-like lactoylglutathione lyase family enzyme